VRFVDVPEWIDDVSWRWKWRNPVCFSQLDSDEDRYEDRIRKPRTGMLRLVRLQPQHPVLFRLHVWRSEGDYGFGLVQSCRCRQLGLEGDISHFQSLNRDLSIQLIVILGI
jgi:hypothetical protein